MSGNTILTHWPSGIRDTTEFPQIDINIAANFREHLKGFCALSGTGWNDYEEQKKVLNKSDSRLRTYRKMYEMLGVVYKDIGNKISVSRLGLQMNELENSLEEHKKNLLQNIALTAIDILSRYQLKNPLEEDFDNLPDDCDVLPGIVLWSTMAQLNGKIHYEEMNRVILRVMKMSQLAGAITKISNARSHFHENYNGASDAELNMHLGVPVHTDQVSARIAPWFSFLGWGGLIIENNARDDFRHFSPGMQDLIEPIVANPPSFYNAADEEDWLKYYIGDNRGEVYKKGEKSQTTVIPYSHNRIFFGAPGTGKSYDLKKESSLFGKNIERVTFYPNYSYAQFVGTYKPVMQPQKDNSGGEDIVYEYVPGPFIRQWIKAQTTQEPVLLIIEELNRANAPAVFGDMFQLLDRKNGSSEYPVTTSEDLRKYLRSIIIPDNIDPETLKGELYLPKNFNVNEIVIPDNMYIWATMNSADQGVFPLDTAFKRRWDYKYFSVFDKKDSGNDNIDAQIVILQGIQYKWGTIREKINNFLARKSVNEDKFIGPYFISETIFSADSEDMVTEKFINTFSDKVIMYLFEDAARQYRKDMFQLTDKDAPLVYSKICKEFREHGFSVFRLPIPSISENANTANKDDDQK